MTPPWVPPLVSGSIGGADKQIRAAGGLARDVLLEGAAVLLELAHPAGNHVANRDNSDKFAAVEDRHVPDPALGHDRGDRIHVVRGARCDDRGGHDVADVAVENGCAALTP